jgi:hypothetical protein
LLPALPAEIAFLKFVVAFRDHLDPIRQVRPGSVELFHQLGFVFRPFEQSEPPLLVTQIAVLMLFIVLATLSAIRYVNAPLRTA